ncbi:putative protein phosphatase 2C 21, partial [Cucurbita argyrosperma subsp. argyrosperma]
MICLFAKNLWRLHFSVAVSFDVDFDLIWREFTKLKMGIYLSSPKTEKASDDGENERLRYGLSSMQGWRATMEDAVSFPSTVSVPFDVEVCAMLLYSVVHHALYCILPSIQINIS